LESRFFNLVFAVSGKEAETNDVSKGPLFAKMMQRQWKKEIEQAIESVKSEKEPSDLDEWVRWYRCLEDGRKKKTEDVRSVFRVRYEEGVIFGVSSVTIPNSSSRNSIAFCTGLV